MEKTLNPEDYGYDLPALPGMSLSEVQTPALIIEMDALERNLARMRDFVQQNGIRLRAHSKTHKSADLARLQMSVGGASGICCQKVSEVEAMVRAGIPDVFLANEVRDPVRIRRLAALARQARIGLCVDDPMALPALSAAADHYGVTLDVAVEIDCGAGRCGATPGAAARDLALAVAASSGLRFIGIQSYHGGAQHLPTTEDRATAISAAGHMTAETVDLIRATGLDCPVVTGAGTGTFRHETASGIWNELQCGSYVFMDADYRRALGEGGFEHALFVLSSVMSLAPGRAVCDAGLKSLAADSGLPVIADLPGTRYVEMSDEHGTIEDPSGSAKINQRLKLIPGHCDPTCNLHDWYVCMRNDVVEALWPVTARGKSL